MLAKSHTMLNPLIYHIINREFRYDMYAMIFGQVKAEKRQLSTNLERHSRNLSKQKRKESKKQLTEAQLHILCPRLAAHWESPWMFGCGGERKP
ncbi:Histamine H2 receptor [Dissostichus eleginoides]|uniref:Histamine H2 receptor n=1 Tax=Dissostichus eleginoides TaxID=100907 RepID=A0AAD9C7H2_DISEL|nr:Histamine H2 receptor [Dissostichus eleginoides]